MLKYYKTNTNTFIVNNLHKKYSEILKIIEEAFPQCVEFELGISTF